MDGGASPRFNQKPDSTPNESTATLLKRLVDELSTLIRQEVALAKTEISEAATSAKRGAISIAGGGFVLFAGFLVLLAAAVAGLANVVDLWLAALIIGAIVTIIGFIMIQGGKKKLQPEAFKPERTQASLQKDKATVQDSVRRRTT